MRAAEAANAAGDLATRRFSFKRPSAKRRIRHQPGRTGGGQIALGVASILLPVHPKPTTFMGTAYPLNPRFSLLVVLPGYPWFPLGNNS